MHAVHGRALLDSGRRIQNNDGRWCRALATYAWQMPAPAGERRARYNNELARSCRALY